MGTVERFEDLRVWNEAKSLAGLVYRTFRPSRDFGFKDQIQRASVSIMNNIAEGFERGSDTDFIRFLYIAKSSAGELRSMLYLAKELEYVDPKTADDLLKHAMLISGSLSNFIRYLKNNNLSKPPKTVKPKKPS